MFYPEFLYYKEMNKLQLAKADRLINKAMKKNLIKEEDLDNCSEIALDAFFYPSIRRCLSRLLKKFNLTQAKNCIRHLLTMESKEELTRYLKVCQKKLAKHPLSIFVVSSEIHDTYHTLLKPLQ